MGKVYMIIIRLKTLTAKIKKILNKAQDQFQERHSNV